MTAISRWADAHQYDAEPQPTATEDSGVRASVKLLSMTSDPLGEIAALCEMYKGTVIRSLADVTDDMRRAALSDMQKTKLQAPLEQVQLHFLVEGVNRGFSHQMVRQRTANYAQESTRFAVLGDLLDATTLPPSLQGTKQSPDDRQSRQVAPTGQDEKNRKVWDDAIRSADTAYHYLVENGIPAEEARDLLPHAAATRIHYNTNLRNFGAEAGKRLCTQAMFAWREIFALMADAIRNYTPDFSFVPEFVSGTEWAYMREWIVRDWEAKYRWQFEAIADSPLLRPVCYQTGACQFEADFDRSCTIRERVQIRRKNGGADSSQWHKPFGYYGHDEVTGRPVAMTSPGINPAEWLLNPAAARKIN